MQQEIRKVLKKAGEDSSVTDGLIDLSNNMQSMVLLQGAGLLPSETNTLNDRIASGEYLVTLLAMGHIGERLAADGLFDMVIPWRERHFVLSSRVFDFLSPWMIESSAHLCSLLREQRQFEEERRILRASLEGCQAEAPPADESSWNPGGSEAVAMQRMGFGSEYWLDATEGGVVGPLSTSRSPGGLTQSTIWARL